MSRLVVNEFMSLDGVAQAPGGANEDRDGGFAHGGWNMPFVDETAQRWILDSIVRAEAYLLGRRTYEIFAAYWPSAPEEVSAVAVPLNTKPKHVVSTTLHDPLPWEKATILGGDVPAAVSALRAMGDGEIHVIGSTKLVQTLLEHDLVDEFRVMIDPVLLGSGKRFFNEGGRRLALRLQESKTTTSGAILATYGRERESG